MSLDDNKNLSLVIPVYNESEFLERILNRVSDVDPVDELVIVDDHSQDDSYRIIREFDYPDGLTVQHFRNDSNRGKGYCVREGIKQATGDIIGIQDADLEYFPEDIPRLLEPLYDERAEVVYGSRNLSEHKSFSFYYYLGNSILTLLTNIIYNIYITDVETCYKFFRKEVVDPAELHSDTFTIENELTARIVRNGYRIYEVPIRYSARSREEGKKITAWDGIKAAGAIFWYRFF
ncbi:MAG: glycosyltransferase family 2 protein [bacterium]